MGFPASKRLKRHNQRNIERLRIQLKRAKKETAKNASKEKLPNLAQIVKNSGRQKMLQLWAHRKELIARRRLRTRKITYFTFCCSMLAVDALFSKNWPRKKIKIMRGKHYAPEKTGFLSDTTKRDILEKLYEAGISTATRTKEVEKQAIILEQGLKELLKISLSPAAASKATGAIRQS